MAAVLEVAHPLVLTPLSQIERLSASVDIALCVALVAALAIAATRAAELPRYPPSLVVWPRAQLQARGIALLDWTRCPPRIVELGAVQERDGRALKPAFEIGTATMSWVPVISEDKT